MQKAKEKYSKEKASYYYAQNKGDINEESRECSKNLSQEERGKIKSNKKLSRIGSL